MYYTHNYTVLVIHRGVSVHVDYIGTKSPPRQATVYCMDTTSRTPGSYFQYFLRSAKSSSLQFHLWVHRMVKQYCMNLRATGRGVVAAIAATASDAHSIKHKVGAAVISTENVIILTVTHRSCNIYESDIGNGDSVRRFTGRTAIQVVLLHIDTVVANVGQGDVLVANVVDLAGLTRVSLDSTTVLAADHLRIGEGDSVNRVVALAANRADAKTMTTVAVHSVDDDICSASHRDTVILVVHPGVLQGEVAAFLDIEAVGIVCRRVTIALAVGGIAGGIVEGQAGDSKVLGAFNLEAVDGPVLDVEVLDAGVVHVLHYEKVVGPNEVSSGFCLVVFLKTDLSEPPLEPWPSQYAAPLPSMTCPSTPVMVTLVPETTIGSKSLSAVSPNVYTTS